MGLSHFADCYAWYVATKPMKVAERPLQDQPGPALCRAGSELQVPATGVAEVAS